MFGCCVALLVPQAHAQSREAPAASGPGRAIAEARTLLDANDLVRARARLDAALAQDPSSADAHYLLGLIAERQNDLGGASSSYQTAITCWERC
jgi:Tfp pilus assembly protein PilF